MINNENARRHVLEGDERMRCNFVASRLLAGSAFALFSQGVIAQTVTGQSSPETHNGATAAAGLADIIVTANRRAETVQRSSLAIQAFNPETLRSAGVTQATDLNKLAQGLQIATAGPSTQIYIRGVGDFSSGPLANPGVAFNVDGVYVGRSEAVAAEFYDIARLEVLKGPQGTLYGRNASGGAINLITNSPTMDAVKGVVNVEVGNYSEFHVDGAINLPLSDKAAVRAAVNRVKRDGYLSDGSNDDDQLAGRIKLLLKPDDRITLAVSADAARSRGIGAGYVYLPHRPGASAWEGTTSPAANAYEATYAPFLTPGDTSRLFSRENLWNVSAQLDWDMGFATLTILPAYRHTHYEALSYHAETDLTYTTANQKTLEVRLGHASPVLKWVIGGYYFQEKSPGYYNVLVNPLILNSNVNYDPKGTSFAGFGEATITVVDGLRLIAGGRYTTEKRSLTGNSYNILPDGTRALLEDFGNGHKRFNSFTWRLGAEFDVAPQSMLFATASTGFKSGGLSQTAYPYNVYRPEKVLAFEVGSRNRFLDNKLQVNVEGFYWKYKDQQNAHLTFDSLGILNFITENAGKANIYGVNVDVVAKMSDNDTLHIGGEYAHSRYTQFINTIPAPFYNPAVTGCSFGGTVPGPVTPLVVRDCSGFALPHVPLWSGTADFTHVLPLSNEGALEFNTSVQAATKTWLNIDFTAPERAPAYAVVNAQLTYRSPKRNYSVTAFVRNLNNAKVYTGGQQSAYAPAPLFTATINPPRTYGVSFHVTF